MRRLRLNLMTAIRKVQVIVVFILAEFPKYMQTVGVSRGSHYIRYYKMMKKMSQMLVFLFLLASRMIQAKKSRMSLLLLGSMRMGIMLSIWMVWLSFTFNLRR
jgi:NAD-specific glutamate dehydrogenase